MDAVVELQQFLTEDAQTYAKDYYRNPLGVQSNITVIQHLWKFQKKGVYLFIWVLLPKTYPIQQTSTQANGFRNGKLPNNQFREQFQLRPTSLKEEMFNSTKKDNSKKNFNSVQK